MKFRTILITIVVLMIVAQGGIAQDNQPSFQETYQMPPKPIADLIDAPQTPYAKISPDNNWLLLIGFPGLPSIEDVSQPELRLAGLRINPHTNGSSRVYYRNQLTLLRIVDGFKQEIEGLPSNPHISDIEWSPDSKYISFTLTRSNRIELWIAETKSQQARQVTEMPLSDVGEDRPYHWLSDQPAFICRVIPPQRGDAPVKSHIPQSPIVRENIDKKAPARTYQDLLENPHDERLLEYYLTSQIVLITLDGQTTFLGSPAMYIDTTPSPDGQYILVETIHHPFSYLVLLDRFPLKIEVWDINGNKVKEIADLPLADGIPIGHDSVRKGPRWIEWRADVPAALTWAEAQDGGDQNAETNIRDQVFMLTAPFQTPPQPLIQLGMRYRGATWNENHQALITARWWTTRHTQTWLVNPDDPDSKPRLLIDRSYEDRYNDPGDPLTKPTTYGTRVLLTKDDGNTIFMRGDGASSEGDQPFLDEFNLTNGKNKRLWQSQAPYYEYTVRMIDHQKIITRRESATNPPNYHMRNLATGSVQQLTDFPHPTPSLMDVQKELIYYQRADGLQLTAMLYLPPDYAPDQGPLPMLMWAYPRDYKSADAASQVRGSPYQFVRVNWRSPLFWTLHGYAVLDKPAMPIVGEGNKNPNDTFIEQLVINAQAAVDEVVKRKIADPNQIAIGGHSYGAFMAANLLAHSDLFCAGIARSGAYNRILTPFGFQKEDRTFWEATDIYLKMSPYMHADHINEPLLLIHGQADNNAGTHPIQSERFYEALKGLGVTTRLVMLPHESHWYRARESVMHMAWEITQWLDTYVK